MKMSLISWIAAIGSVLYVTQCGGGGSGNNVRVTAGGIARAASSQSLHVGSEYEGIGINYSESVVEGFKIDLTGIVFGTGVYGTSSMTTTSVFDWADSPKELEIRDGFDSVVDGEAKVAAGSYDWLQVTYQNAFEIKAYAYFDANNDGTTDTTMYTTVDGIRVTGSKLTMSEVAGYGYYRTTFNTSSGTTTGTITVPSEPLTVVEDQTLYIDLKIDTYRVTKAWDGRLTSWETEVPEAGEVTSLAPAPGSPFNSATVGPGQRYQVGTPAFALMYLPMFVTANTTEGTITSHTYLVAATPNYTPYNTSVMSVIISNDGSPLIGQLNGGDGGLAIHVGPMAKHFEAAADGSYGFYTGGTTGSSKPEYNDGGFFYNSEIEKASHKITDYTPLSSVGSTGTMTWGNATRCDDEYNYCVTGSGFGGTATNGLTRALYLKRVR